MRALICHICSDRIDEPKRVALRNHLLVDTCFRCWFLWPDAHKDDLQPLIRLLREPDPDLILGRSS
jgi:hypothetical protein